MDVTNKKVFKTGPRRFLLIWKKYFKNGSKCGSLVADTQAVELQRVLLK